MFLRERRLRMWIDERLGCDAMQVTVHRVFKESLILWRVFEALPASKIKCLSSRQSSSSDQAQPNQSKGPAAEQKDAKP